MDRLNLRRGALELYVTMGCPFECAHCLHSCSPKRFNERLSMAEMGEAIYQGAKAGVRSLVINGGEPLWFFTDLLEALSYARDCHMATLIRTNGYWARGNTNVANTLKALKSVGVTTLWLSYDNYHAPFIPFSDIKRIINSAVHLGVIVKLDWCGVEVARVVHKAVGNYHRYFREPYGIAPIKAGRASQLGESHFYKYSLEQLEWECPNSISCGDYNVPYITLASGGLLYLDCCLLNSRLAKKHSAYGDWLTEWARLVVQDEAVRLLHASGVGGLIRLAKRREPSLLRSHYSSPCELCFELLPKLLPSELDYITKGEVVKSASV